MQAFQPIPPGRKPLLLYVRPGGHAISLTDASARRWLPVLGLCLLFAASVHAHDVSQSESAIDIRGTDVRVTLTLNGLELAGVDRNGDGRISYDELDEAIEREYAEIKAHYILRAPAAPVRMTVETYQVVEEHMIRLVIAYRFDEAVTRLEVTSRLDQITKPDHKHLASVRFDGAVHQAILSATEATASFTAGESSYYQVFASFLRLGVEHILTGYDHLAFLVGLLLGTSSIASLIKVITSFTVAHSLTLGLATFDLVVLPTRVTESLIALSIAYVGFENLFRSGAFERYRITFLFGLMHGFGFSNVLREMQLPQRSLALSLFSFNAGVEVGQIVFVLVVFPMMVWLSSRWWTLVRPALSGGVTAIAIYWFIQRAFL